MMDGPSWRRDELLQEPSVLAAGDQNLVEDSLAEDSLAADSQHTLAAEGKLDDSLEVVAANARTLAVAVPMAPGGASQEGVQEVRGHGIAFFAFGENAICPFWQQPA